MGKGQRLRHARAGGGGTSGGGGRDGSGGSGGSDRRSFKGETVYLTDLIDRSVPPPPFLEGYSFEDCQIRGPVIVTLADAETSFVDCIFDTPSAAAMLWEVPEYAYKLGILGLRNCHFTRCRFHMFGIAGVADDLKAFRGLGKKP